MDNEQVGEEVYISMNLSQYLGHKKLNFYLPAQLQGDAFLKLQEPHLQPVVVSCNQEHYGAFSGCRKTQYIQRELL